MTKNPSFSKILTSKYEYIFFTITLLGQIRKNAIITKPWHCMQETDFPRQFQIQRRIGSLSRHITYAHAFNFLCNCLFQHVYYQKTVETCFNFLDTRRFVVWDENFWAPTTFYSHLIAWFDYNTWLIDMTTFTEDLCQPVDRNLSTKVM